MWYRKAERLGSLNVDNQLEFRGPQNRKVVRPRAAQNLSRITSDLPVRIGQTGIITHQCAIRRILPNVCNNRHPVTRRESNDLAPSAVEKRIVLHD